MPDIYEIEIIPGSPEPIELEVITTPIILEAEVLQTDRPVGYSFNLLFEFDDGSIEKAFIYGKIEPIPEENIDPE